MYKKLTVVLVMIALALAFVAARNADNPPIAVGRSYNLVGSIRIEGKVIEAMGDGWVKVAPTNLSSKPEFVWVNLNQTFYIQEVR